MSSAYRQYYETPFNPVTPSGVGNSLDDSFDNTRPQWTDEETSEPLPGFALLEEKWREWDPAEVLQFSGVDTRMQLALLRTNGDKEWCGYYQPLPLPGNVGTSVELAIYLGIQLASAVPAGGDENVDMGPLPFGLVLGEDFDTLPDTSGFVVVGAGQLQQVSSIPIAGGQGQVLSAIAFDDPGTQQAVGAGMPRWVRLRLRQRRTGLTDYDADARFECGFYGTDWQHMVTMPTVLGAGSAAYKSIGFAAASLENAEFAVRFGPFRVVEQAYDDSGSTIGTSQQLGAV